MEFGTQAWCEIEKRHTQIEEIKWQKKKRENRQRGDKGQQKARETESMIGARARRREWRWNNYKGGQSIRFPQRNTDASTG